MALLFLICFQPELQSECFVLLLSGAEFSLDQSALMRNSYTFYKIELLHNARKLE